jgi:hypothetical protein
LQISEYCCFHPEDFSASSMTSDRQNREVIANLFTGADVAEIVRERGWGASEEFSPELQAWCERAAGMLGSHVADRGGLGDLLGLVFHYDAEKVLERVESHAVLARYGAREVVRRVALLLLDGGPLDSERFKEIINIIKEGSDLRSRDLFHPIRLGLAGRAGGGELDRVILLIDEAAALPFAVAVKSTCARILEFCSVLD